MGGCGGGSGGGRRLEIHGGILSVSTTAFFLPVPRKSSTRLRWILLFQKTILQAPKFLASPKCLKFVPGKEEVLAPRAQISIHALGFPSSLRETVIDAQAAPFRSFRYSENKPSFSVPFFLLVFSLATLPASRSPLSLPTGSSGALS